MIYTHFPALLSTYPNFQEATVLVDVDMGGLASDIAVNPSLFDIDSPRMVTKRNAAAIHGGPVLVDLEHVPFANNFQLQDYIDAHNVIFSPIQTAFPNNELYVYGLPTKGETGSPDLAIIDPALKPLALQYDGISPQCYLSFFDRPANTWIAQLIERSKKYNGRIMPIVWSTKHPQGTPADLNEVFYICHALSSAGIRDIYLWMGSTEDINDFGPQITIYRKFFEDAQPGGNNAYEQELSNYNQIARWTMNDATVADSATCVDILGPNDLTYEANAGTLGTADSPINGDTQSVTQTGGAYAQGPIVTEGVKPRADQTILLWCWFDDASGSDYIYHSDVGSDDYIAVFRNGAGGEARSVIGGSVYSVSWSTGISNNQWHLIGIHLGSTSDRKVTIDGVERTVASAAGLASASTETVSLGTRADGVAPLNGRLADVVVMENITPAQALSIYNAASEDFSFDNPYAYSRDKRVITGGRMRRDRNHHWHPRSRR